MGLESREYMREEDYPSGYGRRRGPRWDYDIVMALIVVNVCVFLLQHVEINGIPVIEEWFQLDPELVLKYGQVWRLTTYDFLHARGGLMHLFFNMFGLWVFGARLQSRLGWQEFLAFYLCAGAFSGVGYIVWSVISGDWFPCIGASGAVAGAIVLYAMYWPQDRFLIYGIFPISAMWLALIYAAYDLYPVLMELSGKPQGGNVAHAAHLAGMLFALLYVQNRVVLLDYVPWRVFQRVQKTMQRKPNLKVHQPEEDLPPEPAGLTSAERERMDELLDKINAQGEASLTSAERDFLHKASQKLRGKR